MLIGNWKSSTILGVIGLSLWTAALGWYWIGNRRLGLWWGKQKARLGIKPKAE